jgi:uncharacterized protein
VVDVRDLVRVGRYPERGIYDFQTISAIFDESMLCYVGFNVDEQPIVMPTIHGRIDRSLYLHGSVLARWMQRLRDPIALCLTVGIVDDIVLARSAYNHTLNYRSAVVLGNAEVVDDERERIAALRAIVEHVCPGRWDDVRGPTQAELDATLVLRIDMAAASAKVRTGLVEDPQKDCGKGIWAGRIPIRTTRGQPVADPTLEPDVTLPEYLRSDDISR